MKQLIFFLFLVCVGIHTALSQEIKVKNPKYNFGFVNQGDTVKITYEIKNIGDSPLYIIDYAVECGCTVLEKPISPIEPGETYLLSVTFDTHNKYDRQDRIIKVFTNAQKNPTELRFKGVVLKPKKKK